MLSVKILQINNVYAEKSTGRITKEIHEGLLQAGHDSVVVYGRGTGASEPGVRRLCPDWYGKANSLLSRITGMPYGGCVLSTLRLFSILRQEKPDVVHLQCINGNFVNIYWLIRWLKKHRIKTVCSLHAEFLYTANCGHALDCEQWRHGCRKCPDKWRAVKSWFFDRTCASWNAMRNAFEGFERDCILCPVSPWTQSRAEQSDILKNFCFRTVLNGVNTKEMFHWKEEVREHAVLSVTAHFCDMPDHHKGGWYLIQLAKRMPEITFWVAGKADETADLPKNLVLMGQIADQGKLAELYRKAKLSILVSKKETFSMPCAESLCCGTPVVGFRAGAPEQIAIPEFSEFVEQGDLDQLERVTRAWLDRTDLDAVQIARIAEQKYSVQTMVDEFLEVYRSALWN